MVTFLRLRGHPHSVRGSSWLPRKGRLQRNDFAACFSVAWPCQRLATDAPDSNIISVSSRDKQTT